mmetsp:Transcript_90340/g.201930  ORF Transcript_90340/g.201930 Transcript_90340/m.201930 type:complete len:207 (-) Transcript_90340:10-630(-)
MSFCLRHGRVVGVELPHHAVGQGLEELLVLVPRSAVGEHYVLEVPRRQGSAAVGPRKLLCGFLEEAVVAKLLFREVPHHSAEGAAVHGRQEAPAQVVADALHKLRHNDACACEGPDEVGEVDGVHAVQACTHDLRCRMEESIVSEEALVLRAEEFAAATPGTPLLASHTSKEPEGEILEVVPGKHTRLEAFVLGHSTLSQLLATEA